ncbi:uncharacterized protein Z520_01461 [Fonsecaea multimorphosa CBS 102226]|uniref:Uncharacterized protein n=1 Tax=Fonsecaea multimorphosa CBS 102226 TaxID=1442371 RepID=A0A0D2KHT2_9EURO|nr:uncharacterized protein Z520_01461 [Fonsecaea multimorphosa CBS 102226]KIY02995.1 hypothetical protein Z520_01461 [Fonsecaea multimorphosa CBS 102226]
MGGAVELVVAELILVLVLATVGLVTVEVEVVVLDPGEVAAVVLETVLEVEPIELALEKPAELGVELAAEEPVRDVDNGLLEAELEVVDPKLALEVAVPATLELLVLDVNTGEIVVVLGPISVVEVSPAELVVVAIREGVEIDDANEEEAEVDVVTGVAEAVDVVPRELAIVPTDVEARSSNRRWAKNNIDLPVEVVAEVPDAAEFELATLEDDETGVDGPDAKVVGPDDDERALVDTDEGALIDIDEGALVGGDEEALVNIDEANPVVVANAPALVVTPLAIEDPPTELPGAKEAEETDDTDEETVLVPIVIGILEVDETDSDDDATVLVYVDIAILEVDGPGGAEEAAMLVPVDAARLEVAAEIDVVPPEGLLSVVVPPLLVLEAGIEEPMVVNTTIEEVATELARSDEVVPGAIVLATVVDKGPVDASEVEGKAVLDMEFAADESAVVPLGALLEGLKVEEGPEENAEGLEELVEATRRDVPELRRELALVVLPIAVDVATLLVVEEATIEVWVVPWPVVTTEVVTKALVVVELGLEEVVDTGLTVVELGPEELVDPMLFIVELGLEALVDPGFPVVVALVGTVLVGWELAAETLVLDPLGVEAGEEVATAVVGAFVDEVPATNAEDDVVATIELLFGDGDVVLEVGMTVDEEGEEETIPAEVVEPGLLVP